MKKLIDLITAFQNLGFVINTYHESVLFVYCDKKSIRHDFRVKEKYEGIVDLILQACGYETSWDNDEVCRIRDGKQKIHPVVVTEFHHTHQHTERTSSDKLLDYITQWGSGRFTVWTMSDTPIIDLS